MLFSAEAGASIKSVPVTKAMSVVLSCYNSAIYDS